MKDEEKFYGHPLIGVWLVPSTEQRLFPQCSNHSMRIVGNDHKGLYIPKIDWIEDDSLSNGFKYWPWMNNEKLQYDEEG